MIEFLHRLFFPNVYTEEYMRGLIKDLKQYDPDDPDAPDIRLIDWLDLRDAEIWERLMEADAESR